VLSEGSCRPAISILLLIFWQHNSGDLIPNNRVAFRRTLSGITRNSSLAGNNYGFRRVIERTRVGRSDCETSGTGHDYVHLACLSDSARDKYRKVLGQLSNDDLIAMADAVSHIAPSTSFGEFREFFVTRKDGKAGILYFVNTGGQWLISEM
jgi:hypothetical protein